MAIPSKTLIVNHIDGSTTQLVNRTVVKPIRDGIVYGPDAFQVFSPNNNQLATADGTTLVIYDTSGDTVSVISSGVTSTSDVIALEYNVDGSVLMVGTNLTATFYNTTTWATLHTETFVGTLNGKPRISLDGLKLAWCTNTSPYFYVSQLSSGSTSPSSALSTPAVGFSQSSYEAHCFNASGSEVLWASNLNEASSGKVVVNVSTGLLTGIVTGHATSSTISTIELSPDGLTWAICDNNFIELVNTTSRAATSTTPASIAGVMSLNNAGWYDSDLLYVSNFNSPTVMTYKPSTGSWTNVMYGERVSSMAVSKSNASWAVTGSIVESLSETNWRCSAYSLLSGELINSVDVTTTSFSIPTPNDDPVLVVVHQVPGTRWHASKSYTIGDEVYPTAPNITPFYYKCVGAGLSAVSEPVWVTTPAGQNFDGTVTWELVERIPAPVANMPLTPSPI